MAQVTWRGTPIITDAEGVWTQNRGMFQRNLVRTPLPRALGEVVKDLGMNGAEHQVNLVFLNVPTANVDAIFSRIENMHSPTGRVLSGRLRVEDPAGAALIDAPHCVLMEATPGDMARRALVSFEDMAGSGVLWDLDFNLLFVQTRR